MGMNMDPLKRMANEIKAEPERLKRAIEKIRIDGSKSESQQADQLQREMKKIGINMSKSEARDWLK